MNHLLEWCRRIRASFVLDEGCYSVARRLVLQFGNEEALRISKVSTRQATGPEVRRWKQIESAIRDISRPDIPYHL